MVLAASGASAGDVYSEIQVVLLAVQSAMLLEIAHSALGLVPSPILTVATQVFSRIFVLWGHLYWVPECQKHWSLMLLIPSWGITEVVRYLFYFMGLLGTVPYPLFYARYSLFMVLYPSGITSEVILVLIAMGAHWQTASPVWYRLSAVVLWAYIPASPGMILNMLLNRKRSFKKRAASKHEPDGVVWPLTKQGDRSSTSTNRSIVAAAARAGPGGEAAAARVLGEKGWRFGYSRHLVEHLDQSLVSVEGCLAMARAGLQAAQESFHFRRGAEPEMTLRAAMSSPSTEGALETAELSGGRASPEKPELTLSYGGPTAGKPYYRFKHRRKTALSGLRLREQVDAWAEYGSIEGDTANALKLLQQNQEKWLDLSGMVFVLLGAGSAMGPLQFLLSCGATIVAVARPKALSPLVRAMKDSAGRLIFPVRKGADWRSLLAAEDWKGLEKVSGCDLLLQTPEIAAWLAELAPGKLMTVGNYTYLDGALHVQVAVACDCIIERLCQSRSDVAVAFLGTATDITVVPAEAAAAAAEAHARAPIWIQLLELLGMLTPSQFVEGPGGLRYLSSIVVDQGPNYILAKRLQHWRALVARAEGHTVSSNVAPSTATASVVSNATFSAAYGGMHAFKPMEIAYEELSASLMAALLVHDLCNPSSMAHASQSLQHPLCLLQTTSAHFGVWRCPYSITGIAVPSVLIYVVASFWPYLLLVGGLLLLTFQYVAFGMAGLPLAGLLPATPRALLMLLEKLSIPV